MLTLNQIWNSVRVLFKIYLVLKCSPKCEFLMYIYDDDDIRKGKLQKGVW